VYTESLCEALIWARNKELLGDNVIELGGNEWHGKLNGYCKSRVKNWMISESLTMLYRNLGVSDFKQFPRKPKLKTQFDTVVAKDFVDSGFDIPNLFREVHDLTKPGGCMIINSAVGISSAMVSMTPNAVAFLAKKNAYDIPMYRIETPTRTFSVQFNSGNLYNTAELRDLLYKFRETHNLRLSVCIKKTSNDEFKY
jgi:hypothetical protein